MARLLQELADDISRVGSHVSCNELFNGHLWVNNSSKHAYSILWIHKSHPLMSESSCTSRFRHEIRSAPATHQDGNYIFTGMDACVTYVAVRKVNTTKIVEVTW